MMNDFIFHLMKYQVILGQSHRSPTRKLLKKRCEISMINGYASVVKIS